MRRLFQSPSIDAAATGGVAISDREPAKDAVLVLGSQKRDDGTCLAAVNDRRCDSRTLQFAAKNDVLSLKLNVLEVGPLRNDDRIAIRCRVNPLLNLLERGLP